MLNNVVKNAMIAHGYGQVIHVCCMCKHYTQASTNLYSWVQNLNQGLGGTTTLSPPAQTQLGPSAPNPWPLPLWANQLGRTEGRPT